MKQNLLLVLVSLTFSIVANGQGIQPVTGDPPPTTPMYFATENLTMISQVIDVTTKDKYYIHLKALIESHKVKHLTNQYKYNGDAMLNSAELSYTASNGQIAMMAVAKDRGIPTTEYKTLFGPSCSTPLETNGNLTESVVVDHLKCRFALAEIKNNTPTNVVTKGRFAMLLNQALNLWIRKLDAIKNRSNSRPSFLATTA